MSLVTDQPHLIRQSGLVPRDTLDTPITVIGAGAIGSHVVLQLVKMGLTNITVWDHDDVSVENMSCQGYRFRDIGQPKVVALRNMASDYVPHNDVYEPPIHIHVKKWEPMPMFEKGIVVCAVDDMSVREDIWNQIRQSCFNVKWWIDTRMGSEAALMYVMNPFDERDAEAYRNTLYKNEDAVQEPCTAKATIYTANMLSGLAAKAVKNLITKQDYPRVTSWNIKGNAMRIGAGKQA